jgi:hypothetical protein
MLLLIKNDSFYESITLALDIHKNLYLLNLFLDKKI